MKIILNDCEELINLEIELNDKFEKKLSLLDDEYKQTTRLAITSSMNSLKKQLQSHMEQQHLVDFVKEKIGEKIKGVEKIEVFPT